MHPSSDACHDGRVTPYAPVSFVQSSRKLAGRCAGVGYSELAIGRTRALGPPSLPDISKIRAANSAQVAVPVPAMWNTPRREASSRRSSRLRLIAIDPVRNIVGARRGAVLIGHDRKFLALSSHPEHGLHEVLAERAVDPGRAQDDVIGIG